MDILKLVTVLIVVVLIAIWSTPALNATTWALDNIQAQSAQDLVLIHNSIVNKTHNNREIVVAVIDTGYDVKSRLLSNHLSIKSPGYDFTERNNDLSDTIGHGSHVSGIIIQVAPTATLMELKYYSKYNTYLTSLENTVDAINYAVDHGAKVINYSSQGSEMSDAEYYAIDRARRKGVLLVTAAGNNNKNIDNHENCTYPACYHFSNMITVAASDENNNLTDFSNYGITNVDVAAPGKIIYSNLLNDRYGYLSGTSQATAFVSGLAALLLSIDPNLTPEELKDIITSSVDKSDNLKYKVWAGGKINAHSAAIMTINRQNARKRH